MYSEVSLHLPTERLAYVNIKPLELHQEFLYHLIKLQRNASNFWIFVNCDGLYVQKTYTLWNQKFRLQAELALLFILF